MTHLYDTDEPGFFRAFLITLGLFFIAMPCLVVWRDGGQVNAWSGWEWVLFAGLAVLGLISILIGWLAPARTVEWWAGNMPSDEVVLIILIVAAPLYFLRKPLTRDPPSRFDTGLPAVIRRLLKPPSRLGPR
ncbi:MAG: hypothetical protein JWM59_2708 [Verrucomicrobiales bacterium]|nr:hypothetical protein [Verrucomicrobiales bacterium]